jgi:hypothetical protein
MSPLDLLKVNVNDHTEKKNNLTYLSWAWGWAEALKADPSATFEVKTFLRDHYTEMPYMDVNGTAMVWVTVTMFGQPRICMLPVMNHRNQPIPSPDAFQVNTAIMRCMTKCLALHGLGLYIYAGEDLPQDDEKAAPSIRAEATTTMGELTRQEDKPKYEKILTKTAKKVQVMEGWDNSNESRKLFTEGMIEYTSTCNSVADLNSYWKSNELQLDSLKTTHPPLYEEILNCFKALKQKLSEKPNE